jgi:hypothetical protein
VRDDGSPPLSAAAAFKVLVTAPEKNTPPTLEEIDDQLVRAGDTIAFTIRASDPDQPAQALNYFMVDGPSGAALDPGTGLFEWTPPVSHPAGPVLVTLGVRDDGFPSESATRTVRIHVAAAGPVLSLIRVDGAMLELRLAAAPGTCFRVETSSDLQQWSAFATGQTDPDGLALVRDHGVAGAAVKWYRALILSCDELRPLRWNGAFETADGQMRFAFSGLPNTCYAFEATHDLSSWVSLATIQADEEGRLALVIPMQSEMTILRARPIACPTQ